MTFGPITIVRPGVNAQVGVVGPKGTQGIPGTNGAAGATGPATLAPIAVWQSGRGYLAGPPASFVSFGGSSFACAVSHTSGTFASDLAIGNWVIVASVGQTGAAGLNGSTLYSGTGVPSTAIGVNGDYYLRVDTSDLYIKNSGAWGSPISNLKGPAGPAGPGSGNVLAPATGSTKPGQEVVFGVDETHIMGAVRTARGDAAYTIQATDSTVAITVALTAPRTFTLPAASALAGGAQILIADEAGGVSSVNTVTILRAGSDTINGATSAVISSAFGYLVLETDGTSKWTVVDSPALVTSVAGRTGAVVLTAADVTGATTLTDWRDGLIESAKLRSYIPMIGAAADGLFDQTGIDVANSVNAAYDGTNKLYYNVDPYTKVLMHFDAFPFTDDVGHTITSTGTAPTLSGTAKFGAGSASFGGAGYLTATQTGTEFASLNQAGPWTLEGQITPSNVTTGIRSFFGTVGFHVYQSGTALCVDNGSSASQNYSGVFAAGTTVKIEVTNSGGTVCVFANGTLLGSAAAQAYTTGTVLTIGGAALVSTYYFIGLIDEVRVSVGIARHTATYTPEVAAFTLAYGNLDLRSATFTAGFTPTKGSIFLLVNPLAGGIITPNTNLIASLSQNAGGAYTAATLALSGATLAGYPIFEANGLVLPGSGTAPKWRVQTSGGLGLQIRGAYAKWQ